jgi:hypothetical protein
MSLSELISQVQSLETQLAVIKAQLKQAEAKGPCYKPADHYGLCAGQSETTEQDLEAAEYRLKWDGSEDEAKSA